MKVLLSILFFLLIFTSSSAQKIYGTVFTTKGDLLPYSSITIKGTSLGASANNRGRYSFTLAPGNYTLVCQHVGFSKIEKQVTVEKNDIELAFILSEQKLDLNEVLIKSGGENPAYAIIRNAIKKRAYYAKEVNGFTCDLYTKDLLKLRSLPKKIMGKKIPDADRQEMGLDTSGQGIIYLSESVAKVYTQQPDKFKMDVLSSRVSGSNGFGFTFPSFISLYNNNVTIFTERFNPRGFMSPIAEGAISLYKYQYLGTFYEDGKDVHSIKVIPRRAYEPCFSGIINICEGSWRIHSFDLILTKKAQLELLDTLQLTQIYVPLNNGIWRVKNQLIHFNFNQFGVDAVGNFLNVYTNYSINPSYAKKFFDKIIIKYDTAVNKKSKEYWDTIRPVPLEQEEKKDYIEKDSIFQLQKDSSLSKRSIDSLKKKQGKIKPLTIFLKGINRTHYSKINTYKWGVGSLLNNVEYNPAEGLVMNVPIYFEKYLKKTKTNLSIEPTVRYGSSNAHLNAWVDVNLRTRDWSTDKKIKRQTWSFSGGKRVSQFNKESTYLPLTNSIGTLFYGDNFIKTYENYFVRLGFSKRYESGFRFSINGLYEDRIPLDNTTDFTIIKKNKINITPNYPTEKLLTQFLPHQVFILSLDLSIKPGQRFIQFPNNKRSIGSKYPTFSFNYTKGVKNILGSDGDFDKWRLTINDDKNLKLAGKLSYKVGIGGFLNNKNVYLQDYQHFNGNRSLLASEYINSFQLASFYANSTNASFYTIGHLEHHFNGLLTNKIPFFKKLNWNLVTGGNTFFVNATNNYVEAFIGIENIFKIIRLDYVVGYNNGKTGLSGFRLGFGGVIGGGIKMSNTGRNRSVNISL